MLQLKTSREAHILVNLALDKVANNTAKDQDMQNLMQASVLVEDLVMDETDKAVLNSLIKNTFNVVAQSVARQRI